MAKMLDVSTMKGSVVMAKMTGIESTAKITLVLPTGATTASSSGVAMRWPFSSVKNFSPPKCWLTGSTRLISFSAGLLSRLGA
jgi:hypothetical protein